MMACRTGVASRQPRVGRSKTPAVAVKGLKGGQRPTRGPEDGVAAWLRAGLIQAKLTLGQPGDRYEAEADQVADRVMRLTALGVQAKPG